jgi:prepilin-type N-terminal cleavage/methylation domain-containing protein
VTRARVAHPRRGFTLIELLVALSLASLVVLSIFASLHTAFMQKETSEAAVEPSRTADLAFELIRRDLENARPVSTAVGNALAQGFIGNHVISGGTFDYLMMFTTAPGLQHQNGDGDVRRVEYIIPDELRDGQKVLIRRVVHNLTANPLPQGDDEIMIRGITGFELVYFDGLNEPAYFWDTSSTTSVPTQANTLPVMVQVTICFERPVGKNGEIKKWRFSRWLPVPCGVPQVNTSSATTGQ